MYIVMSDEESEPIVKKLTKNNIYMKEQKEVLDKLISILDIVPNDNKSLISQDIVESKSDQILKLFPKIKEYYPSSSVSPVKINSSKRKHMSIIRLLLKHHGYKLKYKIKEHHKNGKATTMPHYFIQSL